MAQQTSEEKRRSSTPPAARLMRMATSYVLSQAIIVAARLHLGEHLAAGPKTSDELAAITNTHPPSLYRVMRVLAAAGVLQESSERRFEATELSPFLRRLRSPIHGQQGYEAFGDLIESVRTGDPAFPRVFGKTVFEYLASRPEDDAEWNRWNEETAAEWLPPVARMIAASGVKVVVDVGGGTGQLLSDILKMNPDVSGVLYDLPNVVKDAGPVFEGAGVSSRATVIAGSFLESVPEGGDLYIISRVLLNWQEEDATKILRNTRRAMKRGSERLMAVEMIMPSQGDPDYLFRCLNDLRLWLNFNSRHISEAEYRRLFRAGGFELEKVTPAGSQWSVLEGRPA